MLLIRQASDAKVIASPRPLVSSPKSFDGTLEELFDRFITPNLPSPAAVEAFHGQIEGYAVRKDAMFLVRYVRDTERRSIYEAREGVRFKATDNAPSWWVHAALVQDYRIASDAFGDVIATI